MLKFKILLKPLIILVLVNTIVLYSHLSVPDSPKAEDGILDLTNLNISRYEAIPLNGEWDFFWNKLIFKKDLLKIQPDLAVGIPDTWDNYTLEGKKLPGQGYATYRLHVKTPLPGNTMLGLKTNAMSSAYRIYINEKLVASNGTVSKDPAGETGEFRPQLVFFNIPSNEFDIIVQISNYHQSSGGFWNRIFLGSADNVAKYYSKKQNLEFLTIGSLLVISVFSLARYAGRRSMFSNLFFILFNFTAVLLVDFLNEMSIFTSLRVDFKEVIFIWYTISSLVVLLFIGFYWSILQTKTLYVLLKLYLVVFTAYEFLIYLTDPVFYTRGAMIFNTIDTIFVVATIIQILQWKLKGHYQRGWHVMSVLILMEVYINGMINKNNYIDGSAIGLILFGVIQIIVQADGFFKAEEEKTAAELLYLRAQINPHFLYNTLNTFISLSRIDLKTAIDLLYSLIDYLRESFDIKNYDQFIPLSREINHTKKYLEIEKARFEDRLKIRFDTNADLNIAVPALILQPIIENAIKHGIFPKDGAGLVHITICQDRIGLFFRITDDGVGIPRGRLEEVLNENRSAGIGISNINKRLKILCKTQLHIKSEINIGTEVTWRIPIRKIKIPELQIVEKDILSFDFE